MHLKNRKEAVKSIWLAIAVLFCVNTPVTAEEKVEGRGAEKFPYPWKKFSFIQPRFDRVNYGDDLFINNYVIRASKNFDNFFHLRIDLPLGNTNLSGKNVFGLEDIAVRLMHATDLHQQVFLGYGAEFTFPTATDKSLGAGKWMVHPEIGGIYFLGQPDKVIGTVSLGVGYLFDYAGASDRPHVSSLHITPNVDYWAKKWYIGYYATWKYDFKANVFDLPLDVEAGYTFIPKWTLAFEFILPMINTDKVNYDNELAVKIRYMLPK